MPTRIAHVPTASAGKYIRQLCSHWGHKYEVETEEADGGVRGIVRFPTSTATMAASAEALSVTLASDDAETLDRMEGVFARHLDRFAFREAPLPFAWTAG